MFEKKNKPAASVAAPAPKPVITFKVMGISPETGSEVCLATRPNEDALKLAADLFLISDCDLKVVRCTDYPTLLGKDRADSSRNDIVAAFLHMHCVDAPISSD